MSDKVLEKLNSIEAKVNTMDEKIKQATASRDIGGGAPSARNGESILSSRKFSFAKALGIYGHSRFLPKENAKIEDEYCKRFTRRCVEKGYRLSNSDSVMMPIWADGMGDQFWSQDEYNEQKSLFSPHAQDYDELKYIAKAAASPATSWLTQDLGGSYVPPPTFQNPIEVLRNTESLFQMADMYPLGPSGRIIFPRQTAAVTASAAVENTQVTPTTPVTGQTILSAKKVMSVLVYPNELLRFSAAIENVLRNDMFKSVALLADKQMLEGPGGEQIQGLVTMAAATNNPYQFVLPTVTSNTLSVDQLYSGFIGAIEEQNAVPTHFLMRPGLAWSLYGTRWLSGASGVKQGFVLDFIRKQDGGLEANVAGLKLIRSTNIGNSNPSAGQSYVLCGESYMVGMYGAIEWATTDGGYTLFSSDQSAVRAVIMIDGAPRYPAGWAYAPGVTTIGGFS
jgi:HK97 family phage major capsid protein